MALPALYLGIDVGTQGTKAVVYDIDTKKILGIGSKGYPLKTDPLRVGLAEQSPTDWIQGSIHAVKEAVSGIEDKTRIQGIGVSGQQHGLVALDERKEVIRDAKLWCDTESHEEADELSKLFDFKMGPSFTASKVLWLKRHEPENYAKMKHLLLPKDFINFWLTGEMVSEASDASGSGFFDPTLRIWDKAAIQAIDPDLEKVVPKLVHYNEGIGQGLSPHAATALGLKAGTIVSPGGGDNAMSALATGAVRDGVAVVSLGTSGTLFGYSSVPVIDKSGIICPFCDATGAWLPLICTLNCTEVPEDVRLSMTNPPLTHDQITTLAQQEAPGCNGLNYLPYLRGERTPNWPGASGTIFGLRHTMLKKPGLMYRAALEGVTYSLLAGVQQMRTFGVSNLKELRVVGGGSKNSLWCRIIADSFSVPLKFPTEAETAALGGALQAAAVHKRSQDFASFVVEHGPPLDKCILPNEEHREAYTSAFDRHVMLGEKLFICEAKA